MWVNKALKFVVLSTFPLWSIATESQYDYPACVVRPEHHPKYYCVIVGQDHTIYKQYNLPRGGRYESYYRDGWKKPRRINWEHNLQSMSMYRPDAPDFVYGEKNNMCRLQTSQFVSIQQCSFAPSSGDKRFEWNASLVMPGVDDPTIFMTAKTNPRNNNATFPEGSTVISLDEYVINGRFDEVKALEKCPGSSFNGKYRINTGIETPLVILYILYAILFLLLVSWTIVRSWSSKKQSVSFTDAKRIDTGNTVLDIRLLEERGGPNTPSLRTSKVHFNSNMDDIIQTGFSHSKFGQLVFGYFVLMTLGLNALLIVLILDNTGYFVTSEYAGLFDPFGVIIYVWVPMWFCTSIWLALTVTYKEKMINFFRYSASLNVAERVRMFKPETSSVLLADRSGISQWVQRIQIFFTNTFFFGAIEEGYEETVLVQQNSNGTRFVEFQHLRYSYDPESQRFVPYSIILPTTFDQIVAQGVGLSSVDYCHRMDIIGQNAIQVEMPTLARSIVNEVFVFFYVYQLVCYYVWYFTDYTWVAALNTVVIVFAASINIYTKRSMLASVVHMTNYETNVDVCRDQLWTTVDASNLVPGDLIRVKENWTLPCDVVVVKGSTVCDESMLTGESMPVQKSAVPSDSTSIYLSESTGKKYSLLAGTNTLASGRQEEILAVVRSTGAHTSRGQLVQSILFPITLRFKYDEHLKAVVGFLFLFAFVAAYLAMKFLMDNAGMANKLFAFVYGMFMFSAVLNPLLPVVITIGQVMAAKRLEEKKVFCLNPHRITLAGKVRLFCFDKTGTITKQGLDYRGIVPAFNGTFTPEMKNSEGLLGYAMASCHAVGSLNGELVGNEVEVKMFESTSWTLVEIEGEAPQVISPSGEVLKVVKRFEFDHHRMSMSVVMQHASTGQFYVFCKGSYEKIQTICNPGTIPVDYLTKAEGLAKEGCYVLGMSYKQLNTMSEEALSTLLTDRDAVESDLSFLSLLMFRNELKPDSQDAILTLKQGDVRCVMITGDNAMTGCYIARASGMVESEAHVLLGDVDQVGHLVWHDIDTYEVFSTDEIHSMLDHVELAVTGKAFDSLVATKSIHELLFSIRIFSRMTPQGKVDCVQLFMEAGVVTGMCGDGGNDCGALRIAHVGVALSEAEASVVSPFTSQSKTLSSVVDIVIEGRGALATSFASVKYLILYGLIGIGIRFVMYKNSVFISQFGFMYLDGAISTGIAYAITRARPLKTLGTQRPTSSLLGPTTLFSILGQTMIHVIFLYFGIQYVMHQDWYCPFDPTGVNLVQWWHLQDSNLGSSLFVLGCFQQSVGGITCSLGSKFRRAVFRNKFLMVYYIALIAFLSLLWLGPPSRLTDQFRMSSSTNVITLPDIPSPLSFRWKLFWIGVLDTVVVIAFEWIVVLGPVRDYFRTKYHKDHLLLKM